MEKGYDSFADAGAACGGKVSIADLEGFWYPVEGIGSNTVEIPIGDADTLVTDTGETYWIKGY